MSNEVVVQSTGEPFAQTISASEHTFVSDEPVSVGGGNGGPTPYDLFLAALGSCTSMTLRMYAARKQWPLERVTVTLAHERVHAADCQECENKTGKIDRIHRQIQLEGEGLDDAMRARLMKIADMCPVHRTLTSTTIIDSALVVAGTPD